MADQSTRYNKTGALVIGLLQILLGLVLIGLQIPIFTEELIIASASVGFWTGIFFILCGVLSVCSYNRNRCLIVGVMTMDILGSLFAVAGLIGALVMGIAGSFNSVARYNNDGEDQRYKYDLSWHLCLAQVGLCIVEGILCIVGSALCCAGVCCTQPQQMQVMYVTTGPDGSQQQNAMYVTPGTVVTTNTATGQALYPQVPPQGSAYPYPQGQTYAQEGERPPAYTPYPDFNKA